jgi:hypothetical protein
VIKVAKRSRRIRATSKSGTLQSRATRLGECLPMYWVVVYFGYFAKLKFLGYIFRGTSYLYV